MSGKRETITFSKLFLDRKNPRLLGEQPSQRDAIHTMLRRHGDDVAALAHHIVNNGRDPADLFRVIPELDESGKRTDNYTVVDGNRRLAAYRVLETPELIPHDLRPGLKRALADLSQEFDGSPGTELCVVYPDRKTANPFVELAHRGKLKGAGRSPWSGMAGAYFDKENSVLRPDLEVLEFVRNSGKLSEEAREKTSSDSFTISTLERMIEDSSVRKHLGISLDKGMVKTPFPQEEVLKPLTQLVEDIAEGRQTSRTLNDATAREAYAKKIVKDNGPDRTKKGSKEVTLSELTKPQPKPKVEAKPSPPPPRLKLVPPDFNLELKNKRLGELLKQMKKLSIKDMPDVGGILLRVFMEWSVEEYIRRHNVNVGNSSRTDSANRRLIKVVDEMARCGHATRDELKVVSNAASNEKSIINMETLHGYVHNPDQLATTIDVRQSWDQLENFFKLLHDSYR